MKRSSVIFAIFVTSVPALPVTAQSVADQKAEVDLATARVNLDKAQAELFAAIRTAAAGSTSTIATPDKTVEATIMRRAAYRLATKAIADDIARKIDHAPLTIHFGSAPPSLAAWFAFKDSKTALDQEIAKAEKEWGELKKGDPARIGTFYLAAAPAAFALLTGLSLLKTDSAISGASIKADDVEVSGEFTEMLPADLKPALETFVLSKNGATKADELLGATVSAATILAGDADQAKGTVKKADDKLKALPAGAPAVEDAWTVKMRAAAANLATALADYQKLRANLLSSTDGVINAVLIDKQQTLALADSYNPLFYVLSHEASLTSISKKNVFTGISSTPVSLSVLATINYVVVGKKGGDAVRYRGSISCLLKRKPFDKITTTERPLGTCEKAGASIH